MQKTMKGQYFSFDAILATVIFVLGITLLSSHWFALRAQIDSQDTYMIGEAYRISDLLIGVGEPSVLNAGNEWYRNPLAAGRAGFAFNSSKPNLLRYEAVRDVQAMQSASMPNANYNQMRELLSTPVHFWVNFSVEGGWRPELYGIGYMPPASLKNIKTARVSRVVALYNSTSKETYFANMTVYTWVNKTG